MRKSREKGRRGGGGAIGEEHIYEIREEVLLTDFRRDFHLRQQGKVGLITTSLQTLNFTDEIVAIPFASSINEQFTTSLQQQYFEAAARVS